MTNFVAAVYLLCSWERFDDAGHLAANGYAFNSNAFTCATRCYPLGTRLRLTDTHNGLFVIVTVTDRPAKRFAKLLDLSPKAFERLNGLALGLCRVRVEKLVSQK